jgi:hypothetical protein
MRKIVYILLSVIVVLAVLANTSKATLVKFDFDALPYLGGPPAIETYMENIYGSDITVTHGIVGDIVLPGVLGPDHYIQTFPLLGSRWFSFSFNEIPITSVSFDWGVEASAFYAYADDTEIFNHEFRLWSSGTTETFSFDTPVTTLKFEGSCLSFEIQIDNLTVTPFVNITDPIPEPATIALLGLGTIVLLRKRKA